MDQEIQEKYFPLQAIESQQVKAIGMTEGVDATANPQSAMFDDISLLTEAIPEPSATMLGLLALSFLSISAASELANR